MPLPLAPTTWPSIFAAPGVPRIALAYGTRFADPAARRALWRSAVRSAPPASVLAPDERISSWYQRAEAQLPRILVAVSLDSAELPLHEAAGLAQVTRASAWLFVVPGGGVVVGLVVDYTPSDGDLAGNGTITIRRDFGGQFQQREGPSVLQALIDAAPAETRPQLASLRFDVDNHQQLFFDVGTPPLFDVAGDLDEDLAQRLCRHDAGFTRPPEPNAVAGHFAAMKPGISFLAQWDWLRAPMFISVVLIMGALGLTREIRDALFAELELLQSDGASPDRSGLAARAQELGRLHLDLTFGVSPALNPRLLTGDPAGHEYHTTLVRITGAQDAADVVETMLQSVDEGVRGELAAVAAEERQADDESRRRTARRQEELSRRVSLVTGLVLIPTLVATVYGANVVLPGKDDVVGLVVLLALMIASAAFTAITLRRR